jgi:hypothetical protein
MAGQSLRTKQERLITTIRQMGKELRTPMGKPLFINGNLNKFYKKRLDSIVKQSVAIDQAQDS